MMEAARSLGIAARFVSGYIFVPNSSGLAGGGATHAWMQAYLPGAGWIDFDPTNSIIGNRNLIRVAVAWVPDQVLPLWGTYEGSPEAFLGMDVTVTVTEAAGDDDMTAPRILRPRGLAAFVFFCDHASNYIPAELHDLGLPALNSRGTSRGTSARRASRRRYRKSSMPRRYSAAPRAW
jgi:hypothetical protein